ncbi:MAG: creatinine amidohydrolase [Alphaproteobacteria bacterium]|nr:creatinine amidohydrolase [Alphaproteobacteria bacterium]
MQLALCTWPEIDAWLTRSKGIIVPVGSTEQHGPTGLIGTDTISVEMIAKRAGEAANILVAPVFPVGVAAHHMAFAGSMSLRPETFRAAIRDWAASLDRHGFRRIYFFNGHGGNIAPLNAAVKEISNELNPGRAENDRLECKVQSWWQFESVHALCQTLYPEGHGSHATPSEVAITQYAFPDAIKSAALEPRIAPTGRFTNAEDYRAAFPDGRIGSNPALANPADGEKLVDAAVAGLIVDFQRFTGNGVT